MYSKSMNNIPQKLKKAFDWIEENLKYSLVFFHEDMYDESTKEEFELQEILCGKLQNPKKRWKQLVQLRLFVMLVVAMDEAKKEGLLVAEGIGPDGYTMHKYIGGNGENKGEHSKWVYHKKNTCKMPDNP